VSSSISGLLSAAGTGTAVSSNATFQAFVDNGNNSFLGVLQALQQNNVAKILADPTITAVSGRPAHFNVGGEVPIPIPQGLGQIAIQYKKFGTQIDFVPIVLGNGNIRLEVRPRVSEIDTSRSLSIAGFDVPGFTVREVDTAVELKAGQTLALAGLVQTRIDATERSLPFLGDLPFIGAAFRSVQEQVNEVELLILVTPEFVDGLEPHEVPQCGPGMETVSPTNSQLYFGGHLEVPACGPCGPNGGGGCNTGCQSGGGGCSVSGAAYISDPAATPATMPMVPVQVQPQPSFNYIDTGAGPINTPMPSLELSPQMPPILRTGEPAQKTAQWSRMGTSTPGLMGPIGYDVEK